MVSFEDKWILQRVDDVHHCEPNRAKVTAELLRQRMKNLLKLNPAAPCGEAVRTVRIQAAKDYGDDSAFYNQLITELGTESALEKQLSRVGHEIIDPTPRIRNDFDPINFLEKSV